ncbi:MAG: von Willebrand factor type A domain-containing protein [Phycisphaeraceae bacterium]
MTHDHDHHDDAQLTAYALGELTGPEHADARAAVEARLATDPAARAQLAELRALAGDLTDAFAAEPAASLTPAQRNAIADAATADPPPTRRLLFTGLPAAAGLAACLLIAAGITMLAQQPADRPGLDLGGSTALHYDADTADRDASPDDDVRGIARGQVERERQEQVDALLTRAMEMRMEMRYDRAAELVDRALAIDPDKPATQAMKAGLEDSQRMVAYRDQRRLRDTRMSESSIQNSEATQPYSEIITYPHDWPELTVRRLAELESQPAEGQVETRVYDVRDLLVEVPNFENAPQFSLESTSGSKREHSGNYGPAAIAQDSISVGGGTALRPATETTAGEWVGGIARNANATRLTPREIELFSYTEGEPTPDAVGFSQEDVNLAIARNESGKVYGINGVIHAEQLHNMLGRAPQRGQVVIVNGRRFRLEPAPQQDDAWRFAPITATNERFAPIEDNPFRDVWAEPLSTFSSDVSTGSYTTLRRMLAQQRRLPPADAVRIEEMLNYFSYDYSAPADADAPFAANVSVTSAPWTEQHRLVRIGIKGYEPEAGQRPAANLVFLVDVSGSMRPNDRLPLLKQALTELVQQLGQDDTVAIVTYAGSSRISLEPTSVVERQRILRAIDQLGAGGSTHGADGIQTAYRLAEENLLEDGINRVILGTDGDFNVGITDRQELARMVEDKASSGIELSVLGFGMGNLKDETVELLARKGQGQYAYLDGIDEARRVLVEQLGGTLHTIARDVKLQVEFNPARVARYRLIGYEKRIMPTEHFADDTKRAGNIGAGHTVTALYEVVPVGVADAAQPQTVAERRIEIGSEVEVRIFELIQPGKMATFRREVDAAGRIELPVIGKVEAAGLSVGQLQRRIVDRLAEDEVLRDATVEVRVVRAAEPAAAREPMRYQRTTELTDAADSDELLTLNIRYKLPDAPMDTANTSKLIQVPVADSDQAWEQADADTRFAAAVAGFGMLLRDSPHKGSADFAQVIEWAEAALGDDPHGRRAEFVDLVRTARDLHGDE